MVVLVRVRVAMVPPYRIITERRRISRLTTLSRRLAGTSRNINVRASMWSLSGWFNITVVKSIIDELFQPSLDQRIIRIFRASLLAMLGNILVMLAKTAEPLVCTAVKTPKHEVRVITEILRVDVWVGLAPVVAPLIGDLVPRQLRLLASHRAVHHDLFNVTVSDLIFTRTVLVGVVRIITAISLRRGHFNIAISLSPINGSLIEPNISKHNGALVRAMSLNL